MPIVLKDFDPKKVENWLDLPDKYGLKHEPSVVFVCAWIAFNYIYGLYCRENRGKLLTWANKNSEAGFGDREQWEFFVQQREFENIFNDIKLGEKSKKIFQKEMPRRIIDMLWEKHYHPKKNIVGAFPLNTLNALELFDLIYAVRNNLFHGGKKADNPDDQLILGVAGSFLSKFIR